MGEVITITIKATNNIKRRIRDGQFYEANWVKYNLAAMILPPTPKPFNWENRIIQYSAEYDTGNFICSSTRYYLATELSHTDPENYRQYVKVKRIIGADHIKSKWGEER